MVPREQTPDEHDQVIVKIIGHFYASQVRGLSFCIPCTYVTLDHKTRHKGPVLEIEICTSLLNKLNKLMHGLFGNDHIWLRYNYLKIWNLRGQKNLNIEKITFKVVQLKFLEMHITNQKITFDIFTVGHFQNIVKEHDLYLIS